MILYLPVEHELNAPCIGRCRTFGLRALRSGEEGDEEIIVLPDISTDFAFTLRLASLLTEKQLSPIHLLDVLEDIL